MWNGMEKRKIFFYLTVITIVAFCLYFLHTEHVFDEEDTRNGSKRGYKKIRR